MSTGTSTRGPITAANAAPWAMPKVATATAIAFMMSVIGLSLPEVVILRKVLRPPLIAAFVGVVASGILLVGILFNAVM